MKDGQEAISELKRKLCSAHVLRSSNCSKAFYIHCDASKSVGAFWSRRRKRETNTWSSTYSVTEKECLAAIVSVKRFRPSVEGHDFTIVTDHASLKWLMASHGTHTAVAQR